MATYFSSVASIGVGHLASLLVSRYGNDEKVVKNPF